MSVSDRIGVWIIGARGAVSVCAMVGALAIRSGRLPATGMVSALDAFDGLDLAGLDRLVFGGHDVRRIPLVGAARDFQARAGVPAPALVTAVEPELAAIETALRPGVAAPDEPVNGARSNTPMDAVAAVASDIEAFREREGLSRVIVVNLASVEHPVAPELANLDPVGFEHRLEAGWEGLTSSLVYAYAAVQAGAPWINFTPSPGFELPALATLATARGLPFAGNDGKTGETLLKTVLAPMFTARHLALHTWFGYNLLGNDDGAKLADPACRASKIRAKDEALRGLVPGDDLVSKVSIDYAPSLHDWKTAWDFVHFEGFLGARMTLQFTWQGCDSALAAPLVLDLVRFIELAARRGEAGPTPHLASFFKRPLGTDEQAFHRQFATLLDYAAREPADRRT